LSPTSSYLATAHAKHLVSYLWFNKTLYTHISLRPITESLPLTGVNKESVKRPIRDEIEKYVSIDQIENTITINGYNDARWQNILN